MVIITNNERLCVEEHTIKELAEKIKNGMSKKDILEAFVQPTIWFWDQEEIGDMMYEKISAIIDSGIFSEEQEKKIAAEFYAITDDFLSNKTPEQGWDDVEKLINHVKNKTIYILHNAWYAMFLCRKENEAFKILIDRID